MISIIVPVYKVEPYLHQCITSILNQTFRDVEIILVDDGSPDQCGAICEKFAQIDSRIRVFHQENKGLSGARNLGLQKAKGEYIGFVDSDDWIEPDMYEVLLRRLEETGADICACEMWLEYQDRKQAGTRIRDGVYSGSDAIMALIFNKTYSGAWNKLYKKECWAGIYFPEGHTCEDVSTIYKVFLKAHAVSCTSNLLCHYRQRDDSITHNFSMNYYIDIWNAYYNRYLFLSTLPDIKNDQETIDEMKYSLALVAFKTWRWACDVSKERRNYEFLHTVSSFVRNNFSLFGKRKWGLSLRTVIFFSRYPNDASFAVLHFLVNNHNLTKRVREALQ